MSAKQSSFCLFSYWTLANFQVLSFKRIKRNPRLSRAFNLVSRFWRQGMGKQMTNAFVLSESCITQRSWARRISCMFILCCVLWKDSSGWFMGRQFVGVFWEKMFFRCEYALVYSANKYSWSVYHARYLLERSEAPGAKAPHTLEIRLISLGIAFRSCLFSFLEACHITWPPHSSASSFVKWE